uniref:DNA-methyltransferase n=1 Tax=Sphingomonas sp. TaxID=28214 RepID=UPI0025E9F188
MIQRNTISDQMGAPRQHFKVYCGNALAILRTLPSDSLDMCMTSPPYWGHRVYDTEGVGQEADYLTYIASLTTILAEVRRVLKPEGSLWLNLGDTYRDKSLIGIPWRVALSLIDEAGWLLRNDVIWNKIKGAPDNSKDKLRNIHEFVFHFVKQRIYYYHADAVRSKPGSSSIVNGSVVSATGVTGIRYKRQIELSTSLTTTEKVASLWALNEVLEDVRTGRISDFRMVIRNQQRTTHSDSAKVSGRAKELLTKGFYFLKYHPNGSKPSDVWDIVPEDTQKRDAHFAPYPMDLCRIPILATCPPNGTVLDPFCGTGTTLMAALALGRSGVGIDVSQAYT